MYNVSYDDNLLVATLGEERAVKVSIGSKFVRDTSTYEALFAG